MIKLPTMAAQLARPRAKPTRPALKPVEWPYAEELAYSTQLLSAARGIVIGVQDVVLPALPKLTRRADDLHDDILELIAELRAEYGISTKTARRWALEMVGNVSAQEAGEFLGAYGEVLSVNPMLGNEAWLPEAMSLAVDQNVALIKSIPEQLISNVAQMVGTAVMSGVRAELLAEQIRARFDLTEARAALIAQDQVGKWHGSLQRLRQLDAGIEEYDWSTSRDERVRPEHRAREGKRFRWDQPPPDGPPGIPVRCRCVAIPHLPDWEE